MTHLTTPRGLLFIHGPEAENLLQGTLTQEMRDFGANKLRYAAHLTPQGRIIADALVSKYENGEKSGFLLDVHPAALMPLAQSLHKYAIQGGVDFEDVSDEVCIQFLPHDEIKGMDDPRGGVFLQLPRRQYGQKNPVAETPANCHKIAPELPKVRQLYPMRVPELFPMLAYTRLLPAEADLAALNGVSYGKGCYVGQEIVSRMTYKTTPKKRLYLIEKTSMLKQTRAGEELLTETGAVAGKLLENGNSTAEEIFVILSVRYAEEPLYYKGKPLPAPHLPAYSTKIDQK